MLEDADAAGVYRCSIDISEDGLELSHKGEREIPNAYTLLSTYSDSFTLTTENVIQPTQTVIDEQQISNGLRNTPRNPTQEKLYNSQMTIEVLGSLQLNESLTDIQSGDMEVYISVSVL